MEGIKYYIFGYRRRLISRAPFTLFKNCLICTHGNAGIDMYIFVEYKRIIMQGMEG